MSHPNNYSFEEDDLLSRDKAASDLEYMVSMIKECRIYDGATSIAIDSGWGTGKTFFLSMWKNRIEKKGVDKVIYYNAWEYDDSDSSLLPMVYSIIEGIGFEENENFDQRAKAILKSVAAAFIKISVHSLFKGDDGIIEIINKEIDKQEDLEPKYETIYNRFKEYFKYRDAMSKTIEEIIPTRGNLWFFIDDLDRCKPSYAIDTLENIKHFFNVPRVNFVFAVNMNQLSNTISNKYGSGMDGNAYSKKFFDLVYSLPTPDLDNYVRSKIIKISGDKNLCIDNSVIDHLDEQFRIHSYSLREIDQSITRLYAIIVKSNHEIKDKYFNLNERISNSLIFVIFFIILKDRFNEEYFEILKGNYTLKTNSTDESPKSSEKKYKKWKVIDAEKLFPGPAFITKILKDMSEDKARNKENVYEMIQNNGLVPSGEMSTFAHYIEGIIG